MKTACRALFWGSCVLSGLGAIGQGGEGTMFNPPMIHPLNCQESTPQYQLTKGHAPAFIYYPGESVDLQFALKQGEDNGLTLHPCWWTSPSCEVQWSRVEK